mmetsp:Transcript_1912/g.3627  ORF Transcript_1912/g.3627 Transcript_1912/m.3627 type:complete len:91 (-) Transcript_1912:588-860(-)
MAELKLETAPVDRRVPTQNQAKACYMYYNSWHQCKYDFSDEEPQCKKLRQWAHSMCPMEWLERWEAQRENGTYAGPVPGETKGKSAPPAH